jgi:hypothetical protein
VKFTVTVMITGTGTPFRSVGVNSHCCTASDGRLVEHRDRSQHLYVADRAIRLDAAFEDHHTGETGVLRLWRIDGVHVPDLGWRLDGPADAQRAVWAELLAAPRSRAARAWAGSGPGDPAWPATTSVAAITGGGSDPTGTITVKLIGPSAGGS